MTAMNEVQQQQQRHLEQLELEVEARVEGVEVEEGWIKLRSFKQPSIVSIQSEDSA